MVYDRLYFESLTKMGPGTVLNIKKEEVLIWNFPCHFFVGLLNFFKFGNEFISAPLSVG